MILKKFCLILSIIWIITFLIIKYIGGCFYIERKDGCLPWKFYWGLNEKNIKINRYDLVLFRSQKMEPFIKNNSKVGKMVVGMANDEIKIKNGNVYINNILIANVKYGSQKLKKPLTFWDKTYKLKNDEIFVIGSKKNSWDSRYWGPCNTKFVFGHLYPIF